MSIPSIQTESTYQSVYGRPPSVNGSCPPSVNGSFEAQSHDRRYNDGSQLIIRHLDPLITENHLLAALGHCGSIDSMKLKPDKNFPGRKFAYVTFGTVAQAQTAVMLINSPNFMPGFKASRRPQANMYDPNRSGQFESNLSRTNLPYPQAQQNIVTPNQNQFAVTKEIMILDDSKLPKFDAMIISGNFPMSEFSRPYSMRKNLREFKIDKLCFYAEIISEKREIRWHLVRIRENFEDDFTKIEILYPEKSSEQIEIFKGLLFETEINISKCVLANVEELTQPIPECAKMMKNFLTDGNRGFIRLNGGGTTNDEMHVQLYKTFDCSNNDFASGLENFGFCKMKSQNSSPISNNSAQIISTSTQMMPHCQNIISFPPPEVQNLKCTYTVFRPILTHRCSVKLCHIEKWPIFYVQIICKPFFRVAEIENILLSQQRTMKSNSRLKPGSLVVSNFNDTLHRGIIIENQNNDKYLIYYLDWGNREYTPIASVERPTAFWEIPAMAIPCKIENWQNFTPEQQETLYLTLSNYLESGSILNEVQFIDGPSDRIVLREFIKTSDPAEMAYTVKIPDIEQLI